MITYRLTPPEAALTLFALGAAMASQPDITKRGSFVAMIGKVTNPRTNGELTIDTEDHTRLLAAVDTTVEQLRDTAWARQGFSELATHLRTSGDAHQEHTQAMGAGASREHGGG